MNDRAILKTRFWELDLCLVRLSRELAFPSETQIYWNTSRELTNIREILFYNDMDSFIDQAIVLND